MIQLPPTKNSRSGTFPQEPGKTQKYSRNESAFFSQEISCSLFPYLAAPPSTEISAVGKRRFLSFRIYFNSIRKTKKSKARPKKSSKNATFPNGCGAGLYTLSAGKKTGGRPFASGPFPNPLKPGFSYLYSTSFQWLVNASKRFFGKKP